MNNRLAALVSVALAMAGCSREKTAPAPESATPDRAAKPDAPAAQAAPGKVGGPAPEFQLPALDGGQVSLSQHRGKIVVLEWFNPDCPFIRQAHTEGNLKSMPDKLLGEGVVWLAINSNAEGAQGSTEDANRAGRERYAIHFPILLDRDGKVGHAYGASRTPHMFVVDAKGTLVYAGGVDNSSGGDLADVAQPVNYVADAVAALAQGKTVAVAESKPWGCSVKYAAK